MNQREIDRFNHLLRTRCKQGKSALNSNDKDEFIDLLLQKTGEPVVVKPLLGPGDFDIDEYGPNGGSGRAMDKR